MTQKATKSPKYPTPKVNFDKTCFSLKTEYSFNILTTIFKTLFDEIKQTQINNKQFHTNLIIFTSPESKILVYYHPRDPNKHPLIRIFAEKITPHILLIFHQIENIISPEFNVSVSKKKTSLSINHKDKPTTPTFLTKVDEANFRVKSIYEKKAMEEKTEILVTHITDKILDFGFEENKRSQQTSSTYQKLAVYENDSFRINIRYKPVFRTKRYAYIEISKFRKEHKDYQLLLFFLCLLKSYSENIIMRDGCPIFEIKPSTIELAFDFPTNNKFIFDLLSSITCFKKRGNCGWTNQKDSPLKSYLGCSKKDLIDASNYIGKRTENDYQISFYNKENIGTRLELRLKSGAIKTLKIGSVGDLFTKNWGISFLKTLKIALPNKKAFERVAEEFHYLAKTSLKAFHSMVPERSNNFNRECLQDNNKLRRVLEEAAGNFHNSLKTLFYETQVAIIIPKNSPLVDFCHNSYTKNKNLDQNARIIDLINFFKNLPPGASNRKHKDNKFIWLEVVDIDQMRLGSILIGPVDKTYPDLRNRAYVQNLAEYFM